MVILVVMSLLTLATGAAAQTSYVTIQKTETSSSCSFSAPPDESFWTYVTFKVEHKIQCPAQVLVLETQYLYGSYQSACPAYSYDPIPEPCLGSGDAATLNNGSHWNVETAYQNKWRNYTFGEYVCQASAPFGGGGVSFAKADASSVCP